jgi:hypothetical protein
MNVSRFLVALVLGATGFILLAVAMFGTDNLYYYRTIAYILSIALVLAAFYYARREIRKPSRTTIRPFSMRTSVILVALGSFLLGVTGGILVYDSYWGLNDVLFKPSNSLNINSFNGALLFGFFGAIGAVFLVIGLKNVLWTK